MSGAFAGIHTDSASPVGKRWGTYLKKKKKKKLFGNNFDEKLKYN